MHDEGKQWRNFGHCLNNFQVCTHWIWMWWMRMKQIIWRFWWKLVFFGVLVQKIGTSQHEEPQNASKQPKWDGCWRDAWQMQRMCQKQTRRTRATKILMFVHSNTIKQMKTMSIRNAIYFLMLIDKFLHKIGVYVLTAKAECWKYEKMEYLGKEVIKACSEFSYDI